MCHSRKIELDIFTAKAQRTQSFFKQYLLCVLCAFAYREVGKEREQDAEALR